MRKFRSWILLSLVEVAMSTGRVVPVAAQETISAEPLADDVWLITGAVDNIGVVRSSRGTLFIDVGYTETADSVAAALRRSGLPHPEVVINTHWHHAFGNAAFRPTRIIAHESLRDRLRQDNFMFNRVVPAFPEAALPDDTFDTRLTVDWGNIRIELIHYPAAHTGGDIVAWIPSKKLLFTGDLVVPHVPWIDREAGGSIEGIIDALDDISSWLPNDARIVPGHDTVMGYAGLQGYRSLMTESRDRVARALALGQSRDEIVASGVGPRWQAWATMIPDSVLIANIHDDLVGSSTTYGRSLDCEFRNGRWYNGSGFTAGDWSVRDGTFSSSPSATSACVIDLEGAYVVPGYGDAHKHDLNGQGSVAEQNRGYLNRGVFYVMEQDPIIAVPDSVRNFIARPGTVDVVYHEGVIAPSWSFIADFYGQAAANGMFGRGATTASINGIRIFLLDDLADLDRHWGALARQNPDFIKVILAYSDEFDTRIANRDRFSGQASPGLDPDLLPELVRRAHASGLRVSAHPETRADFRVAVEAGADLLAHLPASWLIGEAAGYATGDLTPYLLTDEDARRAAELGTTIITTAQPFDSTAWDDFRAVHRHNLGLLRQHGARVILGSDGDVTTANQDIFYIHQLGVYTPRELVRMLVQDTPRDIFPTRRIGVIEDRAEASFLVLRGNPLRELGNLRRIVVGIKQGEVVTGRLPD